MKKKSIAINYFYNLLYQLLTIVTPLITTPYLARVLGVENNGIYGYTLSIVTYFVLFGSLGTNIYGQREIAYVQDNIKKRSKVFKEIMNVKLISYSISTIIFILLFCINNKYNLFYRILIVELLANFFDISWFFQGMEDFQKTVLRNLIVRLSGLLMIFLLVKSENDLYKYFIIYVLSNLIGNLSLWIYLPKYIIKIKEKLNMKSIIKPILLLFVPQVAIQIYTVLDKTMVGFITKNMSEVAYYDQAQKIIKTLLLIVSAMGAVMSSRVANSFAKREKAKIKEYLEKSFNIMWVTGIPMLFGTLAISDVLVPVFFGKGYEAVISIMNVSSLIIIAIGLSNVTGTQYLIQVGEQKVFTKSVVIGALINVIFNFILIKKIGTVGAAISSVLSEFVIFIIQAKNCENGIINYKKIFSQSIKYIISGMIMYIVIVLLKNNMTYNVNSLITLIIVGAITYFIVVLILKDKFLIDILNILKNKIKKRCKNK